MIVLLDSNIWVSLAINGELELIAKLKKDGYQIVSCQQLAFELIDVLSRPKFKKYFSGNYVEEFIKFHQLSTETLQVTNIESVVSDKDDDYLFALCKVSRANFFVTGDKLLLSVKHYGETTILSLSDFKRINDEL
jgi:putative PIN family toxin of toxin-antitoxin system